YDLDRSRFDVYGSLSGTPWCALRRRLSAGATVGREIPDFGGNVGRERISHARRGCERRIRVGAVRASPGIRLLRPAAAACAAAPHTPIHAQRKDSGMHFRPLADALLYEDCTHCGGD